MTFMPLSLSTVKKTKRGMAMQKENKRDSCSYKSRAWWKKEKKKIAMHSPKNFKEGERGI